jgi:thiosulfate dehydrogenase [quinone] large subunit
MAEIFLKGMLTMNSTKNTNINSTFVEKLTAPPAANVLFSKVRWAWAWLIVRLYIGIEWLKEGLEKLESPDWVGTNSGAEVVEFATTAIQKTNGEHPDVLEGYARFLETIVLPNAKTWGFLITYGEILVGVALILGFFTGIAAFFGGLMNLNYLLAGSVGINPIMLVLALLLILAWRRAGWWGIDRWVLPIFGTPWQPGFLFQRNKSTADQLA